MVVEKMQDKDTRVIYCGPTKGGVSLEPLQCGVQIHTALLPQGHIGTNLVQRVHILCQTNVDVPNQRGKKTQRTAACRWMSDSQRVRTCTAQQSSPKDPQSSHDPSWV